MSESFAELFEESLKTTEMKPGTILMGSVVDITPDFVVVSAGLKSEGVIPIEQFRVDGGDLDVAIGDTVEVALDAVEDGFGETRLSREKARRARSWAKLEEAFEGEEIISGRITGKVKGGFTVEIDEIRAFLPGSLVDVRPVRDTGYLEGKELDFKVIKLDQRRNNVVVSRRAVVESEYSAEREALLEKLQEGIEVMGIVKNLTDYGAFLDLGGIDGLLHITDMAWKRVKHPSEVVEIGQEVKVKVLKFDRERNRVSLGLKQLGDDPWSDITRRYPESSRLFGRVTNIADYGCFVEIEEGVEGLVHVSEMDWTNRNVNPGKVVAVGDEVEVMIIDIDEERRRISLGIKQCKPNPWDEFASWNDNGEELVRNYKKGDELEAIVLSVDPERERISLGVKQIDQDPFAQFVADNPKNSIIKGTVTEVDAKGVTVHLADGIDGYLRASEISRDRVEDARQLFKEGDEIEAKFVNIDRKSRMLNLSIKAKDNDEEAEMVSDYGESTAAAPATTLGDILKEQMERN